MRRPQLRLKLWVLAALVALIAVGIGAEQNVRRVCSARERAAYHEQGEARSCHEIADAMKLTADQEAMAAEAERELPRRRDDWELADFHILWPKEYADNGRNEANYWRTRLDYHARMRGKHERACRFPWPGVAPDAPEPRSTVTPPLWILRPETPSAELTASASERSPHGR